MKKTSLFFVVLLIIFQLIFPWSLIEAAVSPAISDFLCEKGTFYFDQGKYPEALIEFKKALLANPESVTAREFIGTIEGLKTSPEILTAQNVLVDKISSVNAKLDKLEKEQKGYAAVVQEGGQDNLDKIVFDLSQTISAQKKGHTTRRSLAQKLGIPQTSASAPAPELVVIDIDEKQVGKEELEAETNVGERLILKGKNISRFLILQPGLLQAKRQSPDEILLEPQDIGSSYMHVWDDQGRKTIKFIVAPRKWEQEFLQQAQERYKEANLPESFRFSYSIDGDSFYSGRGIGDIERKSHVWSYSSSLIGETPFGNFDSAVSGSRSNLGIYKVSNLRMGITNGHYDQFKDINIRWFDFTPDFAAFGFPGADLRGIKLEAPMFSKKINYMTFWGAIPSGGFTQLESTSGLSKTKQAWLEGLGLNYRPSSFANFRTFYVHSYGPELSQPVLTNNASGFGMNYNFGHIDFGTEMTYDHLSSISYTANTSLTLSKLRVGLSIMDINKNFASLLGGKPAGGSTSENLNINYRLTPDMNISNSFSRTVDKVFGNPDRQGRPNYSSTTNFDWTLDSQTDFEAGYTLDDRIGSNAPTVTETKHLSLRKKLFFIRQLSTFVDYQNSKSKNYTSPTQDYNNNRVLAGLSLRLISELYAFYHKEINYLRNTFTNKTALPTAQEYGLNYFRQIFNTPFYLNSRIFYRNEENTESVLSFLSGEDRLEGEAELDFKPNPDSVTYIKLRVTNVWAEKEGVAKHFDLDLSWGMRFVWDTGLRWQSQGGFCGYVYYDVNGDGTKQIREQGVKGAQIKSSDGKTATTDALGYYNISGIVGKKASLELNLKTIPKGYSPTTTPLREVDIVHAKTKRLDFGITTRSEISGLVFYDKNGNGKYDAGEEPVKGVVIILDGKEKASTSLLGEYMFRKLSPGEHTLKLELKSLPIKFIPNVSILKTVKVLEGASFVYNIPLKVSLPEKPIEKK